MKTPKPWKIGSALAATLLFTALVSLPVHAQTYPTLLEQQSPLDFWRFDETAVSPVINTISNLGSAGTLGTGYVVQAVTGVAGGVVGNCILFGNPGQNVNDCISRIDIPNVAVLNPEPPFTVEIWVKPNSPFAPTGDETPATGLAAVSSLTTAGASSFGGARSGYVLYINPGGAEFRVGGVEAYTASAMANFTVSTNSWTYFVGAFDGSAAYLYVNGVLAATGPISGGPFQPNIFVPTRIGGTSQPGGEYEDVAGAADVPMGNRGWDGLLDEFAVYNTLLSSNTIAAHYNEATSDPSGYDALILASRPVGYWNFDEPAYTPPTTPNTVAADSGSLIDNGANTLGSIADQPGVAGTGDPSVFYSGVIGSLAVNPAVTNLYDIAGEPLTLAAWIKPVSFGYIQDIIAQGYNETNYAENFLRTGTSYDWEHFQDDDSVGNTNPAIVPDLDYYEVGAYDGGPNYVSAAFPAPAGDLGHWVFLVGTFDGNNWNLYRNANLVARFPGTWADKRPSGPAEVNEPWSVGSRSYPSPYFSMGFAGSIAEASIMTNALDGATILSLYNSSTLPPVITQAPVAPSPAKSGSSATFSVWADGPGGLSYQWYSNNVAVSGQTTTNYSLNSLTGADDATYSVVVTSPHGSVTSAVTLVVTGTLTPATLVPAVETRWLGFPLSFASASLPNQQVTFQWDFNGQPISGATNSSYTAPAVAGAAGSYTLVLSNTTGVATSSVATLSLIGAPNLYVSRILADNPVAYLRLDESAGPTAYDYAGGNNGAYFGDITFGVPGYSLIDTDTAVSFPGVAETYVGDIGANAINFYGPTAEFSIEAWANGPATQVQAYTGAAIISKGHGGNGTTANEQFAISDYGGVYRFFARDDHGNLALASGKTGPDGNWHHLVGVFDGAGGTVTLYEDGAAVGSGTLAAFNAAGLINSQDAVTIGSESSEPGPTFDLAYNGAISQVAIYATNLSAGQVLAHYAAAYGQNLKPFITIQPASATNYVNLPLSFLVNAAGTLPLTYQWNKAGSGPIPGATSNSFTIPVLALSDAGTYNCGITNPVGGILSTDFTITVLPPPSKPPAIAGLVMHLTFDNTLIDATGRGNNATDEATGGATLSTNDYVPGQIGEAFTYSTSVSGTNVQANYATVGIRPDLQFGTDSFTVSMWVRLPPNYEGNNLPFFADVIGSNFGFPGYSFEPSFGTTEGSTAGWPGGWGFSVYGSTDAGEGVYGDVGSINDGNWHNLIYIIDTVNGASVYLDGVPAHQNVQAGTSVVGIGNINSTNAATIGQDPTGQYPQSSDGNIDIDDLGVWNRALTPLEAASIYMAGSINNLSFVGVTNAAPPPAPVLTVLHSFTNSDGANPQAGLTASGNALYGTTYTGGASGDGVVFTVNTDGSGFRVLHNFTGTDGNEIEANMALAGNTLYGAASSGGPNSNGTLFSLGTDGTSFTNVYSFSGAADGGLPNGPLLAGNILYGTTENGPSGGDGTVFAVETNGSNFTALHSFSGPDGIVPQGILVLGDNVLYGTTYVGGADILGAIFSVQTDGTNFALLHSFSTTFGTRPKAGLVLSGGNLYGTTATGGTYGQGIVFSINANGSNFTLLHQFNSSIGDGSSPYAPLSLSGNVLYGTTESGGASNVGTVFSIDTDGSNYTQVYSFGANSGDGMEPYAPVILAGNSLYGTTRLGGSDGYGTVFGLQISGVAFTLEPVGATNVAIGTNVDFTAVGESLSMPTATIQYQWRLNGVVIAGATTTELAFQNVQPTNGGTLTVTISDGINAATSVPVGLSVAIPTIASGNTNFAGRYSLAQAPSSVVGSSNTNGTPESGEPQIITGNPGGKPIWFQWQPTNSGTVVFTTLGSDFDTILGAYTGTNISALTRVPSCVNDDDSGGFLTSTVSFNYSVGTAYDIVVDGYWGASGHVVLSWVTEDFAEPLPTLLQVPPRQTIASNGAAVTLVCLADSGSPTWFFDGQPTGVIGPDFPIIAVDDVNVGTYIAQTTLGGGVASTQPAHVQFNVLEDGTSDLDSIAWNKFLDSANSPYSNPTQSPIRKLGGGGDTRGYSVAQTFSTVGATAEPGEPSIDGQIGGSPYWYTYVPPTNGAMLINTDGSGFNTLLGVFIGSDKSFATLTNIGAAYTTNRLLDGQPQVYIPTVVKGQTYSVEVDGYNGASGMVQLNIYVGNSVVITTPPQSQSVSAGSNVTFTVDADGSTPLSYFWQFKGIDIAGATNSTLTVSNVQTANAGVYTIVISNLVSTASSSATLSLSNTLMLELPTLSDGVFQLQLTGAAGGNYVIQTSTNLVTWIPLITNNATNGLLLLTDTNASNFNRRFYRGVAN